MSKITKLSVWDGERIEKKCFKIAGQPSHYYAIMQSFVLANIIYFSFIYFN